MSEHREALIQWLGHVIDDGNITNDELHGAFPHPENLIGAERKAWQGLSYWADDEDVRIKDPAYAPAQRRSLSRLLERLEAE